MLTIEKRADGILRIYADGQLKTDAYADFVRRFERLARDEPCPMRIELGPDFSGWSVAALWQNQKVVSARGERLGRIAVVGDGRWDEWAKELSDNPFAEEMRFFELDQAAAAEEWLLSQIRS